MHGVVVDANQKLPLKNVELIVGYSPKDSLKDVTKIYTDDKGTFDYARMISGLLSCPKIKIKVRKQGYKEVVKKYKSYQTKTDTIFLIKTTDWLLCINNFIRKKMYFCFVQKFSDEKNPVG